METFSASVAGRHMACHASANLELAIPNWIPPVKDPTVDNAANRGTQLHTLFAAASLLMNAKDMQMMAQAFSYVADVRSLRMFKQMVEAPVTVTWLQAQPETTADLVLYVKDEIHIFDLKTGKIYVEVVENQQLLYYAAAYGPLAPRARGVTVHIVQPWANNIASWFIDGTRLLQFITDAQMAELQILQGSTKFMPGDHCQFCPANPHSRGLKGKPFCPAMMQMLYPKILDEDAILQLGDE